MDRSLATLRPARLSPTAPAVALSLDPVEPPVAFGLAIHRLGRSVLPGRRAEHSVAFGDEPFHRPDAAHEHRVGVPGPR